MAKVQYLVEALNELGCVYRQRGEEGDWEKALKWLGQSWELSKAIGNTFRETDNLEDLSVLHVKWANDEMEWGNKIDGELIQAGPDSPEVARCPACGDEVRKRKRKIGRHGHTYFYRHCRGVGQDCPIRYRPTRRVTYD